MRSNIFYALLIMASSFIACNKTQEPPRYPHWGEANAFKNGEYWECYPRAGMSNLTNQLFIGGHTYSQEGFQREALHLYKIPLLVGTYLPVLNSDVEVDDGKVGAVLITLIDDGDVGGGAYYLAEDDSTSTISITRIEDDEIWGTFNLTFYRDPNATLQGPGYPMVLEFTNGQFHTKILVE